MWVITYEKAGPNETIRRWMRPGLTYFLGRVPTMTLADGSKAANNFVIVNKTTISRRHLKIRLDRAAERSSSHVSQRSKIYVEDLNTKFGTMVNGVELQPGREYPIYEQDETQIQLSRTDAHGSITIKWEPVVFTISLDDDRQRRFAEYQAQLEPMDIKLLHTMHPETTCYVRETKQSVKSLIAMVSGKPIAKLEYLLKVIDSKNVLEKNWRDFPRPVEYLHSLEEDVRPERGKLFTGMIFFTWTRNQTDALRDVVNSGSGKISMVEIPGRVKSSVAGISDAIVAFVESHSGAYQPVIFQLEDSLDPAQNQLLTALVDACRRLKTGITSSSALYKCITQCNPSLLASAGTSFSSDRESAIVMDSVVERAKPRRVIARRKPQVAAAQNTLDHFLQVNREESQKSSKPNEQESLGKHATPPLQESLPEVQVEQSQQRSGPIKRTGPIQRKKDVARVKADDLFSMEPVSFQMPGLENYRKRKASASQTQDSASQEPPNKVLRTAAPTDQTTRAVSPIAESVDKPIAVTELPRTVRAATVRATKDIEVPALEDDVASEPEPEELLDIADLAIEELQGLAIVDVIELPSSIRRQSRKPPLSASQNVPNFKQFKKVSVASLNRVEYVDPNDESSIYDRGFMDEAEQQYMAQSQRVSQLKHSRQSSNDVGRPKKRRKHLEDSDEDLFVRSDLEDEMEMLSGDEADLMIGTETQLMLDYDHSSTGGDSARKQSKGRSQVGRKPRQTRLTEIIEDEDSEEDEHGFRFSTD